MPTIRSRENEPSDMIFRRFKRACEKAGVLTEMRSRQYYEKPTERRKREAAAAFKRGLKKAMRDNPLMTAGKSRKRISVRSSMANRTNNARTDARGGANNRGGSSTRNNYQRSY